MRLRMRAAGAAAGAVATGLILGGLAAGALALGTASAAWAAPSTEVVQGRYLRLVSTADWSQAMRLMPGEAVRWDVEISADAPEPGTIDIGVSASGGAELVADARLCGEAWRGEVCPPGAQSLRTDWEVPRDGIVATLASIPADEVAHLRLNIRLGAALLIAAGVRRRRGRNDDGGDA